MCLVVFALGARDDLPLVVAANRDEFHARPTAPLGPWEDAPQILAGRDLRAGGTWFGVTLDGRWAAVTNFREARDPPANAQSRGHLVADFLLGDTSPGEYLDALALRATRFAGFNLLVGDPRGVRWYSNRGEGHPLLGRELAPGIYGLSNHLLDTPWPKVVAARRDLERELESGADPDSVLQGLLDRTLAAEADLPQTGVPLDLERTLSARFISGDVYGTRSSTVLRIDGAGNATVLERSFAPPASVSMRKHRFAIR